MALNYQEIYTKIKSIGAGAKERNEKLTERKELALRLFADYAEEIGVLRGKVEALKEDNPHIRCALPVYENLNARVSLPPLPANANLIAADGSQIAPDRHGAVQFGVINVGGIALRLNSGEAPKVSTDSQLLFDEELLTPKGAPITEGMVALTRDLEERKKLESLAREFGTPGEPIIAFTDGPIELWGAREGEEAEAFSKSLREFKSSLLSLHKNGVTIAGYVDKPGADLVIRLLELARFDPSQGNDIRLHRPLRGVSDRWLFGDKENSLLKPGERSAVFSIQSRSNKDYEGALALHFFYLNVGSEREPWPVRVEIPQWVAEEPERLNMLHAVLIDQCRQMSAKPYPYLLHRAHEIAVVSNEEKQQVEQLLLAELRRQNIETGQKSPKQGGKDLEGKTRYKR